MRGYKVMYDYRGKVAGMIIAAIGFVLLAVQKITHLAPIKKLNSDQHFNLLLWITLVGLLTMMFSYEKHEDERVKLVRAKTFMIVFMLMVSSLLAFALTLSLKPTAFFDDPKQMTMSIEDVIIAGRMLMFYPAIAVVLYLVMFHVGVYYDRHWDYNDNIGIIENIRKNKKYMLIVAIVSIIIIELIFRFIL